MEARYTRLRYKRKLPLPAYPSAKRVKVTVRRRSSSKKGQQNIYLNTDPSIVQMPIEAATRKCGIRGVQIMRGATLPPAVCVRLKYAQEISINSATEVGNASFRINSIFGPDSSGGGHQPKGFDQWAAFYNRFIVYHARMTCTIIPIGSTTQSTIGIIGIFQTDTGVALTTTEAYMEDPKATWKPYGALGSEPTSISRDFWLQSSTHVKDIRDNLTGVYAAAVTANPSDPQYFLPFIGGGADGGTVTAQNIFVYIEYDCLFSERKDLPQS